ncbi:MAG: hypothetical protein IJJ70_08165 [Treponema sp.]|nr:hypothetical protein [Treponema sp.]MBR0487658.1 hypothetical protein [Treponema sp.]
MHSFFKWIDRFFGRVAVIVLILVVLMSSKTVLTTALNDFNRVFYESVNESQSTEDNSETKEETVAKATCRTTVIQNSVNTTIQKPETSEKKHISKYFLYHILCIVFIIVLGVTVTVLLLVVVKDDSGIRYEKLDALCSVEDKINKLSGSVDKKKTSIEEKTEQNCNGSEKLTNTTTDTATSNYAALLKHYMNCITEI